MAMLDQNGNVEWTWWRRHGDTWSDSHTRSIREVIYRLWEGTRRLSLRHIMCEKIPFWLRCVHPNTLITAQLIQNCEEPRQTHANKTVVQIRTIRYPVYSQIRLNRMSWQRSSTKPIQKTNPVLWVCMAFHSFVHIHVYLYIYISIYLSIYLSIYRFIDLSIYLAIYLSIYLSI